MSRLQEHIKAFIQIQFHPVKANFNRTTVPAKAELGPAQPQLVNSIKYSFQVGKLIRLSDFLTSNLQDKWPNEALYTFTN